MLALTPVLSPSAALRAFAPRLAAANGVQKEANPDRFEASAVPLPTNLLPVPDTRQSTNYSCGASALQAVLMYYGEEYLETELMQLLGTTTNGTNPRDIARVARELGFSTEIRENLTIADLEASVAKGVPVIIAAQAWREDTQTPWKDRWEDGHYMVVVGTDDKYVYFEDPSILGSKGKIPRQEFLDRWHDVDEKPYLQSGIFISGKTPSPPPPVIFVE